MRHRQQLYGAPLQLQRPFIAAPAQLQRPRRCSAAALDDLGGPQLQHRRPSDEVPMQHWTAPAKLHRSTGRPTGKLHCSARLLGGVPPQQRRAAAGAVVQRSSSRQSCDAAVVGRRLPRGAARTASSSQATALQCPRPAPLAREAFSCSIETGMDSAAGNLLRRLHAHSYVFVAA